MNLREFASALRILSIDAVEQAQSGHPGMPLGMADIAAVLWHEFLNHNPNNPAWFNRDRFVLSNGHGSALLYALLHLTGYAVSIEDLKNFRQLHSKTPGHPEYRETPGVETTTGPLGQGLGNAVGLALTEKILAKQFNKPQYNLIDHWTYVFVGDGCLMEGISHEVCSFAGVQELGKLIVFYDSNNISIDGEVSGWFKDDPVKRFSSYNWQVIGPINGHDFEQIRGAITEARQDLLRPTMIICNTHIGLGSNKQDSEQSHGAPLGVDGVAAVRKFLDWQYDAFVIPEDLYKKFNAVEPGIKLENTWLDKLFAYEAQYPKEYDELLRRMNNDLPDNFTRELLLNKLKISDKSLATRVCSQQVIEILAEYMPEFLGGSADLTHSNNTWWPSAQLVNPTTDYHITNGCYLHYGVRELGMAAIMNGIALHGGFLPFGGTFLVFTDYAKSAIRLAALMKLRVIYILTHDSIGLGEDGPTHQPVEHAAMLRLTPNMHVWRPADLRETAAAWWHAINRYDGPTAILLTRQSVPNINSLPIEKGAYIIDDSLNAPELVLLATGSEVSLAIEVKQYLINKHNKLQIRVVSMPCCEVFEAQSKAYKEKILPKEVTKRVAIEALVSDYWYKWVGLEGAIVGLNSFGASGKGPEVMQAKGITLVKVVETIEKILKI